MIGTIFDIKEFSLHDGPGGRVTVFLKGCPLRCLWCHNPEGLSREIQLLHKENLCTHCGLCTAGCSHPECRDLSRCVHVCPNGANALSGQNTTPEALAETLLGYRDFFRMTRGGVTVSGGEPLLQERFVCRLAELLPGVHKAIQTSGYAAPEIYQEVISRFDYIMQDIKLADSSLHRRYTGVGNQLILENVRYLMDSGKQFVFRVPLIPGITDTEENLRAIAAIVGDHPVELLRYNTMAGAKYGMLGMSYSLGSEGNRQADFASFFANGTVK